MADWYETKHNQVEMLEARGYNIVEVECIMNGSNPTIVNEEDDFLNDDTYLDEVDFNEVYNGGKGSRTLSALYTSMDIPSDPREPVSKIYVHYIEASGKQVSTSEVDEIIAMMNTIRNSPGEKLEMVIVIATAKFSPASKQLLTKDYDVRIQFWNIGEVHPPNHILQPKHILLPPEKKREILEKMAKGPTKVNISQLPKIFENDPVVKYYGWKPGNLVKINRPNIGLSTFVDESIYYRLIVPGDTPVPKTLTKFV